MIRPGPAVHHDRDGRPRCGHPRGVRLSADEAEVTCGGCLVLLSGAGKATGARWAEKPCGTLAAYRRHYRHGEKPCESCRQACSRWEQDQRRSAA
jgi:hypothetical protein